MNQEGKKYLASWVAWLAIALAVGIVIFFYWRITSQTADIYNNAIAASQQKSTKKAAATTGKTVTNPATTGSTATTTDVAADDWKTYTNKTYGFTLEFNDNWKGFKAVEKNSDGASILFAIPTTDTSWQESGSTGLDNFATPFVIGVYTLSGWDEMLKQEGPKPTEIARNDTYVFAYSGWQDCPADLCDKNLDVAGIIKTFKFN